MLLEVNRCSKEWHATATQCTAEYNEEMGKRGRVDDSTGMICPDLFVFNKYDTRKMDPSLDNSFRRSAKGT